jgi:CRP-like cAMP-binding protein
MIKKAKTDIKLSEVLAEMWDLLTTEQQNFLTEEYTVQRYKKNEAIYCEGDKALHLYCLVSGKIKVHKNGVGGRNQIIRMIRPIGYFGYRAYFSDQNYVTEAAAFEASTICLFPMEAIKKVILENSQFAFFFIKQLSVSLGVSDQRTVNLTQKHIRGRLAEALLFLKESYGVEEDSCTLSIYLSREDLANLSNMTTSNAIRTLSNFASERIITVDGRKIRIIDEEQLKHISRIG